jgi:AraC-like DNA-binding protein
MIDPRLEMARQLWLVADERITVAILAECAGLSRSRFTHLFFRQTGVLPGEHLRLMRKYRQEQLLAIEIIGKALGFESLAQ